MREIVGCDLVCCGTVLFAAGVIAEAMSPNNSAGAGYIAGTVLGVLGLVVILSRTMRRWWDAIPVDDQERKNDA